MSPPYLKTIVRHQSQIQRWILSQPQTKIWVREAQRELQGQWASGDRERCVFKLGSRSLRMLRP